MPIRLAVRVLAWYQMLAGIAGVAVIYFIGPAIMARVRVSDPNELKWFFLFVIALFGLLFFAGLQLLRRPRVGRWLTVAMQLAQIPLFANQHALWVFFGGLFLTFSKDVTGIHPDLGVKALGQFGIYDASRARFIGVNLVPLLLLILVRPWRPYGSVVTPEVPHKGVVAESA